MHNVMDYETEYIYLQLQVNTKLLCGQGRMNDTCGHR